MNFLDELKRRNVFRVGIAYGLLGWLVLQAADFALDLIDAPNWVIQALTVVIVAGWVLALFFAWAFELTPEGLKREHEVDRSESITPQTGRGLNRLILVLAVITAAYFFWESRFMQRSEPAPVAVERPADTAPAAPATPSAESGPSIAVLPFVNMSADPENEYFADGLSEEILNRLAQVPQLLVIGRTSSFAFKGDNRDLREIGQLLNAGNILEGSVRRQGDSIRVTAQLISSSDGAHLWSQTYDRQLEDVFQVQDDIAQRVVDAMDIVLDEEQRQRMLNAGVRNVEAFVAYQKGLTQMIDAHGQPDQMERQAEANTHLERAAELAPPFAAALAAASDLYSHEVLEPDNPPELRERGLARYLDILAAASDAARDPTRKAMIELDRELFREDWSRLPGILDAAFDAPGSAPSNWMEIMVPFADRHRLIRYFEKQVEHEPMFLLSHSLLATLYLEEGRLEDAEAVMARAQAINPDHSWVLMGEMAIKIARGDVAAARATLEAHRTGELRTRAFISLLALEGRLEEAQTMFDDWLAEAPRDARQRVAVLAQLGDREAANRAAAEVDATSGGPVELIRIINQCGCGAPFDLEATPNLAARLAEAGFSWPPPREAEFPAKDW